MSHTIFDSEIVGQQSVKRRLSFLIDGYKQDGILGNKLFVASRGNGKSTIMALLTKELAKIKKAKGITAPIIKINGGTLKDPDQFFNDLVLPYFTNDCIVALEEAHAISHKVTEILLSILDFSSADSTSKLTWNGQDLYFNPRQLAFIGTTSEANRIPISLKDRFECIALEELKENDLAKILQKNCSFPIDIKIALNLATYMRGDARCAVRIAREIDVYLKVKEKLMFEEEDIRPLLKILNIYPLGLTEKEIAMLRRLAAAPLSLGTLAASLKLTGPECQNLERFSLFNSLMEINGKRTISFVGKKYLEFVDNWNKT